MANYSIDDMHGNGIEVKPERTAEQWWAWHDQDSARWSSETSEAEARCAAWVAGESDDGPSS